MTQNAKKQPSLRILAKYVKGETEIMKNWSKHIENDHDCMIKVAMLRRLDQMFKCLDLEKLAPASKKLAAEIFDSFYTGKKDPGVDVAHLYFDNRLVPLPEGMRPSMSSERRLKYKTGFGDIELAIVPVFPGRFELTGRFEADDKIAPESVILKGRKVLRAITDRFGFFSFAAVNPGKYNLHFSSDGQNVVINNLVLK
jgi:hypothetical protein